MDNIMDNMTNNIRSDNMMDYMLHNMMMDNLSENIKELKSYDNMWELGGFIREVLEDKIADTFDSHTIAITELYCPMGKDFVDVAFQVYKAQNDSRDDLERITNDELDEDDKNTIKFVYWKISQIARLEAAEKLYLDENSTSKNLADKFDIPRIKKRTISKLNALERRILDLAINEKGKIDKDAKDIAALPEFRCDSSFITYIMNDIEEKVNIAVHNIESNL